MSFHDNAHRLLCREMRAALVTLSKVQGSSPREEGAQMLVTPSGFIGSIGGGTLEWQAMAEAQRLLRKSGESDNRIVASNKTYALGPDLGQCCGGRVTVATNIISNAEELEELLTPEQPLRHVLLYGAGHVGKALILLLAQAPFRITWIDPRLESFPAVAPSNVTLHRDHDVLSPVPLAGPGTLVVVMSHSHELDFAVCDASLRHPEVANVLLIGSATKRARFLSRLTSAGHGDEALSRLICPIGDGAVSGKTPYAVALSTAHQMLGLDEALAAAQMEAGIQRERQAG